MNQIVTNLDYSSTLITEADTKESLNAETEPPVELPEKKRSAGETSTSPVETGTPEQIPNNDQAINIERPGNKTIANDVQKKISRPIEKKDLVKAGVIILRKLNSEEINYLYKIGKKDNYSREEYLHARDILLNKLSSEDIDTLQELGMKYGKDLNILDPELKS